ncbi:hypothetical protein BC938DRAFT_478389 [Jimgerdemannia flammicorona]|uniref:C2H2-type domain-containing protein n=1 Tax=Jimgerdemannia flammicorona TaxID=994334 RepID=A0A433QN12_9FUNG|nr:hypothetical protein BC938DRAFT_478389 [Jimgerdemannia flammicorona]
MSATIAANPQDGFALYPLSFHNPGFTYKTEFPTAIPDPATFQEHDPQLYLAFGRQNQFEAACAQQQLNQNFILNPPTYPTTMPTNALPWGAESDDSSEGPFYEFYDSSVADTSSTVSSPEQSVFSDFDINAEMNNTWSCSPDDAYSTQSAPSPAGPNSFLLTSEFDISAAQQTMATNCGLPTLSHYPSGDFDPAALLTPQTAEQMKIIMYEPTSTDFMGSTFADVLQNQTFDGFPTPAPSPKQLHPQNPAHNSQCAQQLPLSPPPNTIDIDFTSPAASASGAAYSSFNNLTTVMRCTHPGCPKTFSRVYNLKAHLKSHVSTKPFECNMCSRSFSRKHDLQRHVRVHTGAKPYVCPCCKKGFARTDALKRHLRIEESCRMSVEVQSMKSRRRYSDL